MSASRGLWMFGLKLKYQSSIPDPRPQDHQTQSEAGPRYPDPSPPSATQNTNPKRVKRRPPTPQPLLEEAEPGAQGEVQVSARWVAL